MKLLIIIGLLFSTASFAVNRESGGVITSAVYVNFISFGSGIDQETLKNVTQILSAAKLRGEVINENQVRFGHEGEVRQCAQFSSGTQKDQYIQAIANAIKSDTQMNGMQRTRVYVGMDCFSFENASEQDLNGY